MAAVTEVTEEYRCGYCWQEYLSMDDPRELPCGHVFCLSCLKDDLQRKNNVLECPVCGKVYTGLDLDQLKKAKLDTSDVEIIPVTQSKCDGADCGQSLAVSFCVDCAEKACPEHEKTHKKHFSNKHRVIPICIYDESPENFKKAICEEHKNEKMIKACKVCDLLICNECDRYSTACHDGERHDFYAFEDLHEGLMKGYQTLLREADTKLLQICKLEKETWGYLDLDNVTRICLMEEAKRARDARIAYEELLYQRTIERIKEDQDAPTKRIVAFNSDLTQKKEALDDMRTRARRLMRDGSITEKIRQRKKIQEAMDQQIKVDLGSCELEPYVLPPVDTLLFEEKMDAVDPDTVSIISCEFLTTKTCYDVCLLPSGEILCAGNRSIEVCGKTGVSLRTIFTKEGDFISVQYYKGRIYALLKKAGPIAARWVNVFAEDTFNKELDWQVPEYQYISMLAVSNDKVYVMDNANSQIKVYSLEGKSLPTITHKAFQHSFYVCSLGDEGVLVADRQDNCVFKIDSVTDTIADKVTIPSPRGVYADKYGNWWVWSSEENAVLLRSADGQKIKRLYSKAVEAKNAKYICGFVLIDGKLLAAAGNAGVLRMDVDITKEE